MENVIDLNSYESFLMLHEGQLKASRVPELYYKALFQKVHSQIFDGGEVNNWTNKLKGSFIYYVIQKTNI